MKQKTKKLTFPIRVFCANCYHASIIRLPRGTYIEDSYPHRDKLLVGDEYLTCPKCDGDELNRIREELK